MAASTDQLHTHALEAEKHLEQLATGLAQVGAPDDAVQAVTNMASVLRKIAGGMAKGMRDEPSPDQEQPATMDEGVDQMMADRKAAAGA